MASTREEIAERTNGSSSASTVVGSFFKSPTVWSILGSGASAAAGYTANPNIVALIGSLGGIVGYSGSATLSLANEADRDFFIKRIDAELRKIAEDLKFENDRVTILQNENGQDKKDGYYLYEQDEKITAIVVKNGTKTSFSLGGIHGSNNFIFQLIHWGNIEDGLLIDGRLGLLLSSLIEKHRNYPKEEVAGINTNEPSFSWSHYFSGANVASCAVILIQTIAFGMCLYETVQYSKNLSSVDEHKYDPPSEYLLAAPLTKMVATLSYWALRKYEDTGREQKSEQYRKSLEGYTQSKNEEKQAKICAWAESVLIIADCKGKIDRLKQIKVLLEKELGKIESIGEKEAVSDSTHEKIAFFVNEFKQILTETREGSNSEEVDQFLNDAANSINDFMENHLSVDLGAAFHNAEKAMLISVKEKLYVTQTLRTVFDITLS